MKTPRGAVDRGAAGDIEKFAHRLSGSLLILGARRAKASCRLLETGGGEGRIDDARAAVQSLSHEVQRLVAYLERFGEE
jgi:HPt (histidine-containing phosphotransfer) domain-containing protein